MAEQQREGLILNDRELATVLAALRYYQSVMNFGGAPPFRVAQIASCDDTLLPLDACEVDDLCQRINA